MKNIIWKWILGLALAWIALLIVPAAWRFFLPNNEYDMMRYGYGWSMPMMYDGYGMMSFGMFFMWLNSFATVVLIGLGMAWLAKSLTVQK